MNPLKAVLKIFCPFVLFCGVTLLPSALFAESYLEWLYQNSTESRASMARQIENDFSRLLESSRPQDLRLAQFFEKSIFQLENRDTSCRPEHKIRLYRGHGAGLLSSGLNANSPYTLNNFVLSHLPRFSLPSLSPEDFSVTPAREGTWEEQYRHFVENNELNFSLREGMEQFIQAHVQENPAGYVNHQEEDQYDLLSEMHTVGSEKSILISFTTTMSFASKYSFPVLETEICYGRTLPTASQTWNEREFLVPFHVFPEEIVQVHMPENAGVKRALFDSSLSQETKERALDQLGENREDYLENFSERPLNKLSDVFRQCYISGFEGDVHPAYEKRALAEQVENLSHLVLSLIENDSSKEIFENTLETYRGEECHCQAFVRRAHRIHQEAELGALRIFFEEDCDF